jgi:hypothetical protein
VTILDGLEPEQQRMVRLLIDGLVARYPNVPDLRERAMYPTYDRRDVRDLLPWDRALCHLSYMDGWHAHRQSQLAALDVTLAIKA